MRVGDSSIISKTEHISHDFTEKEAPHPWEVWWEVECAQSISHSHSSFDKQVKYVEKDNGLIKWLHFWARRAVYQSKWGSLWESCRQKWFSVGKNCLGLWKLPRLVVAILSLPSVWNLCSAEPDCCIELFISPFPTHSQQENTTCTPKIYNSGI